MRLCIEAGVASIGEAVTWAESRLRDHSYDDDVANVALYSGTSHKEIAILIGYCCDPGTDELEAMREVLGKLALKLRDEPTVIEEIAKHLEMFWIGRSYDLPSDMRFIVGLHDSVLLAKDGIYGELGSVREALQEQLERFSC